MAEGELPPGLSPGEHAVFVLLEGIALGLALTGVDLWLVHGKSLLIVGLVWAASLFVSYCGYKWHEIRQKVWANVAAKLERTVASPRFRVGALLATAFFVGCYFLVYLHGLSSALETYVLPRRITPNQIEEMRTVFRSSTSAALPLPLNVFANSADPEAVEYGSQLANAITQAGWQAQFGALNPFDTSPNANHDNGTFYNSYLSLDRGVEIRVGLSGQPQDVKHPTPDEVLSSALSAAHILTGGGGAANRGKYSVAVLVCTRPFVPQQTWHQKFNEWLVGHLVMTGQ